MNYQTILLPGGSEIHIDFDSRQTRCYKCKVFLRFGTTKHGKQMPLTEFAPTKFRSHFDDCTGETRKSTFERTSDQRENLENNLSNF